MCALCITCPPSGLSAWSSAFPPCPMTVVHRGLTPLWGYLYLLDDEHIIWSLGCPLGQSLKCSGTATVPWGGDSLRNTGLEKNRAHCCPRVTEMAFVPQSQALQNPPSCGEWLEDTGADSVLSPCALMLVPNELISCLLSRLKYK